MAKEAFLEPSAKLSAFRLPEEIDDSLESETETGCPNYEFLSISAELVIAFFASFVLPYHESGLISSWEIRLSWVQGTSQSVEMFRENLDYLGLVTTASSSTISLIFPFKNRTNLSTLRACMGGFRAPITSFIINLFCFLCIFQTRAAHAETKPSN